MSGSAPARRPSSSRICSSSSARRKRRSPPAGQRQESVPLGEGAGKARPAQERRCVLHPAGRAGGSRRPGVGAKTFDQPRCFGFVLPSLRLEVVNLVNTTTNCALEIQKFSNCTLAFGKRAALVALQPSQLIKVSSPDHGSTAFA